MKWLENIYETIGMSLVPDTGLKHSSFKSGRRKAPMDDSHNWQDLLYPGEWGFRFFTASGLIWLINQELHDPIAGVVFCVLTVGVLSTLIMQVWVGMKYFSSRRRDVSLHQ